MPAMPALTALLALGGAVHLGLAAGLVLACWAWVARLPEPPDSASVGKLPYLAIPRPWRWVDLALAVGLTWFTLDRAWSWAWLVWASVGLVLVSVDAATTFLPQRLQWFLNVALALALVAELVDATAVVATLTRIVLGALAAGALFWVFWRLTPSFGFGDVRLAFSLGALAGASGWGFWWAAMLLGTALGAVIGIVVAVVRRWRPHPEGTAFAYGPALWAGPWLALLISR